MYYDYYYYHYPYRVYPPVYYWPNYYNSQYGYIDQNLFNTGYMYDVYQNAYINQWMPLKPKKKASKGKPNV